MNSHKIHSSSSCVCDFSIRKSCDDENSQIQKGHIYMLHALWLARNHGCTSIVYLLMSLSILLLLLLLFCYIIVNYGFDEPTNNWISSSYHFFFDALKAKVSFDVYQLNSRKYGWMDQFKCSMRTVKYKIISEILQQMRHRNQTIFNFSSVTEEMSLFHNIFEWNGQQKFVRPFHICLTYQKYDFWCMKKKDKRKTKWSIQKPLFKKSYPISSQAEKMVLNACA